MAAEESKDGAEVAAVTSFLTRTFAPRTPAQQLEDLAKEAAAEATTADVYGVGASLGKLESEVATMMGKEWGVLMVSGVMAQLIASKVHCTARARGTIALHRTSHLLCHEHDSYRELLGLAAKVVGDPVAALRAADVTAMEAPDEVGVLIIELPQRENGGQTMSWDDLVAVRKWATKHDVALHLDGARLWEVQPFYGRSYADICALFDTVYVSFYKGLGGMVGAMLCGNTPLHNPVFTWLRRFGGNIYTQLPIMVSARACLRRHTTFAKRFAKLRAVVAKIRGALADLSDEEGAAAISFVPEVPTSCLVHTYFGTTPVETVLEAVRDVERSHGIQVVSRVRQSRFAPQHIVDASGADAPPPGILQPFSYTEWNMGVENCEIEDDTFVAGWVAFAKALGARCKEAEATVPASD